MIAGVYGTACFIETPPIQGYDTYYLAQFLAAWYWSGAGMMVSQFSKNEFLQSIILIFWPMLEPILDGRLGRTGGVAETKSTAWMSSYRWYLQILLGAEFYHLPEQIVEFPQAQAALRQNLMSTTQDGLMVDVQIASWILFGFGLGFRLICLTILLLEKHSQGGSYIYTIKYALRHALYVSTGTFDPDEMHDDHDAAVNHRIANQPLIEESTAFGDGAVERILNTAFLAPLGSLRSAREAPSERMVTAGSRDQRAMSDNNLTPRSTKRNVDNPLHMNGAL